MFGHPEFFTVIKSVNEQFKIGKLKTCNQFETKSYNKFDLRNFVACFDIFSCKKCNLWKTYILMIIINSNRYYIWFTWMIKETAYISIKICINAKLKWNEIEKIPKYYQRNFRWKKMTNFVKSKKCIITPDALKSKK